MFYDLAVNTWGREEIDAIQRVIASDRFTIGPYVADFACLASRLVIEIDGSHHGEEPIRSRDEKRTSWLESEGYRVVRFWNNDITQNGTGVLDVIYAEFYGGRDAEPTVLKHQRSRSVGSNKLHPTPARAARRPSPSRGG